jgi:hypothetical protein
MGDDEENLPFFERGIPRRPKAVKQGGEAGKKKR